MPRRRPSAVRGDHPHPSHHLLRSPCATLPSLSPGAVAMVARYERNRHYPGAVAYAWRRWSVWARREPRRCGEPRCATCYRWCDPHDAHEWRAVLEGAVRAMPPRDAREWRRRLRELDPERLP